MRNPFSWAAVSKVVEFATSRWQLRNSGFQEHMSGICNCYCPHGALYFERCSCLGWGDSVELFRADCLAVLLKSSFTDCIQTRRAVCRDKHWGAGVRKLWTDARKCPGSNSSTSKCMNTPHHGMSNTPIPAPLPLPVPVPPSPPCRSCPLQLYHSPFQSLNAPSFSPTLQPTPAAAEWDAPASNSPSESPPPHPLTSHSFQSPALPSPFPVPAFPSTPANDFAICSPSFSMKGFQRNNSTVEVSQGFSHCAFAGVSDAVRARCTRGAFTGVVAWTVSANLEATCCWLLCFCPTLYLTPPKIFGQCSHMQNWDWCAAVCRLSACCCTLCM